MATFTIAAYGQDRKQRKLDSMQPEYLNLQVGFAFQNFESFGDLFGSNITLTYEKKITDKPLAWFVNYSYLFGADEKTEDSYDYDPNENYFIYTYRTLEKRKMESHHFGGGYHYYFREYDRKLKLYTGLGAYAGFNHHRLTYENDGSIDGNGLDFGAYGIFGIRWCRGHTKCGFEYRLGYINSEIFGHNESGVTNELSFCIGVQF